MGEFEITKRDRSNFKTIYWFFILIIVSIIYSVKSIKYLDEDYELDKKVNRNTDRIIKNFINLENKENLSNNLENLREYQGKNQESVLKRFLQTPPQQPSPTTSPQGTGQGNQSGTGQGQGNQPGTTQNQPSQSPTSQNQSNQPATNQNQPTQFSSTQSQPNQSGMTQNQPSSGTQTNNPPSGQSSSSSGPQTTGGSGSGTQTQSGAVSSKQPTGTGTTNPTGNTSKPTGGATGTSTGSSFGPGTGSGGASNSNPTSSTGSQNPGGVSTATSTSNPNGQAGSNPTSSGTSPSGSTNPSSINLNNMGLQGTLSTTSIAKSDITKLTNNLNGLANNPTNLPGSTSTTQGSSKNPGTSTNQPIQGGSSQAPSGTNTSTNLNPTGVATTLTQITSSYNQQVKSGQAQPTTSLYDLASATIKVVQATSPQTSPTQPAQSNQQPTSTTNPAPNSNNAPAPNTNNNQQPPINNEPVRQIKQAVVQTTDTLLETKSISTDLNYRTDYFTVQIFKNATSAINGEFTTQNNLAYVDFSPCEKKIRETLNIPDSVSIPVGKINWDPTLTNSNNIGDVSYIFYNPYTGEKINQTEICKDVGIQVKFPTNTTSINTTLVEIFKNQSINILDSQSDFYNSRCFSFSNETSGSDVTLNDRRSLIYPNTSIACSTGCEFSGLDENNFTICDCYNTNETQAILENAILSGLSESNIDIFVCYTNAFDYNLSSNPGFYCNGSFLLVAITSVLVLQKTIYANFFVKFFDHVVQYDTSHFSSKGQILDINSKTIKGGGNTLTEKPTMNFQDMNVKNVEIAKIGSAPPINMQEMEENEKANYSLKKSNETNDQNVIKQEKDENLVDLETGNRPVSNVKTMAYNELNTNKNLNIHETNEIDKIYSYYSKEAPYKNILGKKSTIVREVINDSFDSKNGESDSRKDSNYSIFKVVKTISNYPPPGPRKDQVALNPFNGEENQKLESEDDHKEIEVRDKGIEKSLKIKDEDFNNYEDKDKENHLNKEEILKNRNEISSMITIKDYDYMTVDELLIFDKRNFWKFYWDSILTRHDFLRAFIYKTVLKPFYIRIILFFLQISVAFALNAIFYSDSYISEKNKVVLTTKMNTFLYTLQKQLSKSIWSAILGVIPIVILELLSDPPKSVYDEFNHMILFSEPKDIDPNFISRKMKWNYLIVLFFSFFIHIFAWYYVTVFCSIYTKSSVSWVCGGIISMIIKMMIIQPVIPFILALFRTIYFKWKSKYINFYTNIF